MMVRIKQNYKLIPEKSLVGLAVSQYDADTVGFVQRFRRYSRNSEFEDLVTSNSPFPFSLNDDESNLHSDDGDGTSTKRAFEQALTHHHAPITGRKRAISVMEIDIDDHHK
jgi:hypothetical protein